MSLEAYSADNPRAAIAVIRVGDVVLRLDDPISRWIAIESITIRQLITHTSGLVDYEELIPPEQTEQVSDADVLHMLESSRRALFAPGKQYRYNNGGYVLLGLILERASNRSLEELLCEEIFAKHGVHRDQSVEGSALALARQASRLTGDETSCEPVSLEASRPRGLAQQSAK